MPYSSILELPEQFHGLPERGKRIAVQIMNVLEEQGLIGDGAVNKALGVLNQIFNKGVGSSWGQSAEKAASAINTITAVAPLVGMVPGLNHLTAPINVGMAGLQAANAAGEQKSKARDVGFDGMGNKIGSVVEKENNEMSRIIKFDPNWSRKKEASVQKPLTGIEFEAAKVAFVKNLWEDLCTREIPLQLATYNKGEKTASANIISSLDFTQAFPKIASVIKTAAGSITTSIGNMVEKIAPLALAMGIVQGGKGIYDAYKLNKSYNGMFDQYPELKDADKGRVDKLYNVISNYSPTIAKDPVGSGAMIRTMLNYPDALDFSMIKGLIDLERGVPSSMTKTILDNMAAETGSAMVRPDEIEKMDQKMTYLNRMLDDNSGAFNLNESVDPNNPKATVIGPADEKSRQLQRNQIIQRVLSGTKL